MVRFSQYFVVAALVGSSCALNLNFHSKRDVAKVEADIANISTQVTTLDTVINNFSSTSTLADALTIHSDATKLTTTLNGATTDTKAVPPPVSESDSTTIITAVEAFEPTIIDALKAIVVKKPLFDALPIGGISALVKQDLAALNTSTFAFEAALISLAPADLKARATAIKTAIDAAFSTAIAGYA